MSGKRSLSSLACSYVRSVKTGHRDFTTENKPKSIFKSGVHFLIVWKSVFLLRVIEVGDEAESGFLCFHKNKYLTMVS